eukprot:Colp12_sorted_trinity150504_noHs@20314
MERIATFLAIVLLFGVVNADDVVFQNDLIRFEFGGAEDNFVLKDISSLCGSSEFSHFVEKSVTLWTAEFADANTAYTIAADSPSKTRTFKVEKIGQDKQQLTLSWEDLRVGSNNTVDVHISVILEDAQPLGLFRWKVIPKAGEIGLWSLKFGFSGFGSTTSGEKYFWPQGFGGLRSIGANEGVMTQSNYPNGGATMQYFAHFIDNATPRGLYFAAHDGAGHPKGLYFARTPSHRANEWSFTMTVAGAGTAMGPDGYSVPFPFAVGAFCGDWWDAAQFYRTFMHAHARWVRTPLRSRSDFPEWLAGVPLWVNSGWQGHDIFNRTQGDPAVVLTRVRNLGGFPWGGPLTTPPWPPTSSL